MTKQRPRRVVIRKSSLVEELYLQSDDTWGGVATARIFRGEERAEQRALDLGLGERYGVFPVAARRRKGNIAG